MKIAIIGTGVAGNVAAHYLNKEHDITVFEENDYVGGHTHTHKIDFDGESHNIDTGFIVFNHKTYPNFIKLLGELGVEYQKSNMSFSVQCEKTGLEYNGTTLNSLFAQRRNLFRPSFYRMIKDILRFNRESLEILEQPHEKLSLGEYLAANNYSEQFIHHYIVPMGAAIWSTDHDSMFAFPARFFVQFFHNHGMLSVDERPQWYVIKNGSNEYVKPLIAAHKDKIKLSSPVESIVRSSNQVLVKAKGQGTEAFDYVFIASHSDQALAMLENPTATEREVLSAIPYSDNEAVLHTDERLLPDKKLAWAAWNYHLLKEKKEQVALTYNMNILQSLKSKNTFCVTLNNTDAIDPSKIIKKMDYMHPFFTLDGVQAQQRHSEINGTHRTFYCGAYWRYGFHEDGVVSALTALQDFNKEINNEQQNILWSRSA
ncbi:FAD-dependent oxidoreductase [Aliikangiella marina]|uniref:FAD-dependent oxidoreductase n=1 Tax=Aliikangiella marina TaxID=1712262 RepID=A0A545T8P4_9GAMM|nr:FAD-dependent oxidoreductase [Aliikangiella marina]TQV73593.1 FAD-dependent oxidoreductase [Aliikangiella marina]